MYIYRRPANARTRIVRAGTTHRRRSAARVAMRVRTLHRNSWRAIAFDFPAMFGLHNVPSAHSVPFVKQDRSTCRRYMRTVYWQNGEQVSRTVLTLRFQLVCRGPPGSWHAAISARAILAYFQDAPSNHEVWEEVQPRPVTEVCSECRRMESPLTNRSAHIEARNEAARAHLHDVRTHTDVDPALERTTRLPRSRSPINHTSSWPDYL